MARGKWEVYDKWGNLFNLLIINFKQTIMPEQLEVLCEWHKLILSSQ